MKQAWFEGGVMRGQKIGFLICCVAGVLLAHSTIARAEMTPLQSQNATTGNELLQTDWQSGVAGVTTPTFEQFNPNLGTLTDVDVTLSFNISNTYHMTFNTTPTITDENFGAGGVGPTVTLLGPDDSTTILSGSQPTQSFAEAQASGTTFDKTTNFSSGVLSDTLSASSPLFSEFIGTSTITMPVEAMAFSTVTVDGGTGSGFVLTSANATVTVQYVYTPAVPEPSSCVLLGLGISITLVSVSRRRRRTR
jgi:hypothetical protein